MYNVTHLLRNREYGNVHNFVSVMCEPQITKETINSLRTYIILLFTQCSLKTARYYTSFFRSRKSVLCTEISTDESFTVNLSETRTHCTLNIRNMLCAFTRSCCEFCAKLTCVCMDKSIVHFIRRGLLRLYYEERSDSIFTNDICKVFEKFCCSKYAQRIAQYCFKNSKNDYTCQYILRVVGEEQKIAILRTIVVPFRSIKHTMYNEGSITISAEERVKYMHLCDERNSTIAFLFLYMLGAQHLRNFSA